MAGQSGFINLVNGSPFTWSLSNVQSAQMAAWDTSFPGAITPGQAAVVSVRPGESNIGSTGQAMYTLQGDGSTFQVRAVQDPTKGFDIQVGMTINQRFDF